MVGGVVGFRAELNLFSADPVYQQPYHHPSVGGRVIGLHFLLQHHPGGLLAGADTIPFLTFLGCWWYSSSSSPFSPVLSLEVLLSTSHTDIFLFRLKSGLSSSLPSSFILRALPHLSAILIA